MWKPIITFNTREYIIFLSYVDSMLIPAWVKVW